jgi:Flp pilus assembly protein TadB
MTPVVLAAASTAAALAAVAAALAVPAPRRHCPRRPLVIGVEPVARRPAPSARALRAGAAVGAVIAALLLVPGVPGLVVAGIAGPAVWLRSGRWESSADRRRREALEAEVPHVVDLLVAALHVGAAPAEALERVATVTGGPMGEELESWLARLRLGADPVAVWRGMAEHPQLGRLGATLARSAESGAPVAEALRRLSDELADRARADVEARVRQVEVKAAVPLGVCLLPAFVLTGVVPLVAGAASQLIG